MQPLISWSERFVASVQIDLVFDLLLALVIGSLIGLERSYSGRPAGFRTHALVSVSSALLMLASLHQGSWLHHVAMETVRTDPTRMAQGIMTGIGFLGAGVIFKEGLTVRGLTTAASIWMTAAIGTLIGIGFHFPAVVATLLTLGVLALFRMAERCLPTRHFAEHVIQFNRDYVIDESDIVQTLEAHHCSLLRIGYSLKHEGKVVEYATLIRTLDRSNFSRLAKTLLANPAVRDFAIRIRTT